MLRIARQKSLLATSSQTLDAWLQLNDVAMHDVRAERIPDKGMGLVASKAVKNSDAGAECLLTVPRDLILSHERVREHAKVDKDLREVIEACGELCQTARGAILVFLILQLTTACGVEFGSVGVHSPFIEYVKSLPEESTTTRWTVDELALLRGTTLEAATMQKLSRLRREYDELCSAARHTTWHQHVGNILELDDWIEVDAMYRSRALEYPGIGHCMVPCLDLANHESGDGTVAVYELDAAGNAILLLRNGKELHDGDEVTISYGDEKGACEMLFSYGFLAESMNSAEALFLDLKAAAHDPFAAEKLRLADCAPGVKLIDTGNGQIDWTGDYVWLLCVNSEDGLHFDIARLTDGSEEVQAFLGDRELKGGAAGLRKLLLQSDLWEVYRLRAVAILQDRVFEQMQALDSSQDSIEQTVHGTDSAVTTQRYNQAQTLRRLEFDLLNEAYEDFEKQKLELADTDVVKRYLNAVNASMTAEEDFS